jgi:hypothetical protein
VNVILAIALQLLGLVLVAVAAGFWHPAASAVVVGCAVFAAGFDLERKAR